MKCIVRNNNNFELIEYGNQQPKDFVFDYPQYNGSIHGHRYHIVENSVDIHWTHGTYQGHYVSFKHKGIEFKRIGGPTLQVVMEQLNHLLGISENEIELLAEGAAKNKINVLKGEIAAIEESKKMLRKECNKLVTLLELGQELSTTIKNFDENRGEDLQKLIDLFKK
jgi:hypothetical protein